MQKKIIIICGPTATGKTAMAIDIAREINGIIINADSQQVYREIPIITAQPTPDEHQQAPHRLYGCVSVREYFSVALWLDLVNKEINDALASGKTPILVGGTGMYIKSLMNGIAQIPEISKEIRNSVRLLCDAEGTESIHKKLGELDPEIAAKLNPGDRQRVLRAYEVFLATGKSLLHWQEQKTTPLFPKDIFDIRCLLPDRATVYDKCNRRLLKMLDEGLLDEMRELNAILPTLSNSERGWMSLPAMRAHGLREFISHLNGEITIEEAIAQAQQMTRNYVKRQFTWFKHQMADENNVTIYN
jgi:tRNA dimethylallyltransferase